MQTVSFIIPVYNEENRLPKTFHALKNLRLPIGLKLNHIIFINDGSTDKTQRKLQTAKRKIEKHLKTKVTLLSYPENKGKGFAVRQGMLRNSSDYALLFDADISTPLTELRKFMPYMTNNIDVIIGTRKNGKSTVVKHQPLVREQLGRMYTKMVQITLACPVTDFTCGFKAFSKISAKTLFKQSKINRWGYDAEILVLAKQNKYTMKEAAVLWSDDARTKVNLFIDIPRSLKEMLQVYKTHVIRYQLETIASAIAALFHIKTKSAILQ